MSESTKRTKTTPKRKPSGTLTIREYTEKKDGKSYTSFMVQGWKEDGKYKRKKFKTYEKAQGFIAKKQIELLKVRNAQSTVLTSLSQNEVEEAESAIKALGSDYSLKQAVEYFLANHRPPEFTIRLEDGIKLYIYHKERKKVRPRTIRGMNGILKSFSVATGNPLVHEVTPQAVQRYMKSLKGKDGNDAKLKTWNNHRNELSQFFDWAIDEDLETHRPWRFNNPVSKIEKHEAARVAEQRPETKITSPDKIIKIFDHLMTYDEGSLAKMFALAYFAGIRPDIDGEMGKLAKREKELINLETGIIKIPADVAKTKRKRNISISDNLREWLTAYGDKPILPINFADKYTVARKPFDLQQDEARHSFISYHVALNRSIGDTALQAGNSEKIIHDHYLNITTYEKAEAFFSIVPDRKKGKAAITKTRKAKKTSLKAV